MRGNRLHILKEQKETSECFHAFHFIFILFNIHLHYEQKKALSFEMWAVIFEALDLQLCR